MSTKWKVLVADDHFLMRQGLETVLKSMPQVGESIFTSNGQELMQVLRREPVDMVIIDVEMPVLDGVETVKAIRRRYDDIKIMVLSVHTDEYHVSTMHRQQVNAYLSKECDAAELKQAIREVMEGKSYWCQPAKEALLNNILDQKKGNGGREASLSELSAREIEVIRCICDQQSIRQIADKLSVSENTVKRHRYNIMKKTGCHNVAGLYNFAIKKGIYKVS